MKTQQEKNPIRTAAIHIILWLIAVEILLGMIRGAL